MWRLPDVTPLKLSESKHDLRRTKGESDGQREAHGSADDRSVEAGGSGPERGGSGSALRSVEAHDLRLKSEVRWPGRERGARSEAVARRERPVKEVSSRSELG